MRSTNQSCLYSIPSKMHWAPEDLKGLQLVLGGHSVSCYWHMVLLLIQGTSLAKYIPYGQSLLMKRPVARVRIVNKTRNKAL